VGRVGLGDGEEAMRGWLGWVPLHRWRLPAVGVDGDELHDRTDRAWTTATFQRVPGKEEGFEATEMTWVVAELEETDLAPWTGWQTPIRPAWLRLRSTSATSGTASRRLRPPGGILGMENREHYIQEKMQRWGKQRSRVEKGGGLVGDEQQDNYELVSILLDGDEQRSVWAWFLEVS
jgi:hypothetical protein